MRSSAPQHQYVCKQVAEIDLSGEQAFWLYAFMQWKDKFEYSRF